MTVEPFVRVTGVAAALLQPNIDTDTIMPKQFLKGIDRGGLGQGFLFDLRFHPDGKPRRDFVLNRPPWSDACFLVVGPNFGCGSSREHAVWGMRQFGIRAVIGTTYGGIFQDNCARNGVLAISLSAEEVEALGRRVGDVRTNCLAVDLQSQTITGEARQVLIDFGVDALQKDALLRGLDMVSNSLRDSQAIEAFERAYRLAHPWLR
jgi:3-isopropylmalate/(R)-2-methylmalate dehydratase small subunit